MSLYVLESGVSWKWSLTVWVNYSVLSQQHLLVSWQSNENWLSIPEFCTLLWRAFNPCVERFSSSISNFERHSYNSLDNLNKFEGLVRSLFSCLLWRRFEPGLNDFLRGDSSLQDSDRLWDDSSKSFYSWKVFILYFIANAVLHFPVSWQNAFWVSPMSQ